jgi:hypothetical protein
MNYELVELICRIDSDLFDFSKIELILKILVVSGISFLPFKKKIVLMIGLTRSKK